MDQGEGRSTVKGLLAEIKDASELMVDLAFAAVYLSDSDLAREVARLEERMFIRLRELRKLAILAARSPEDADHMAGVLGIAAAVEKIADAATVHRFTGLAPSVALHVPWDQVDDFGALGPVVAARPCFGGDGADPQVGEGDPVDVAARAETLVPRITGCSPST